MPTDSGGSVAGFWTILSSMSLVLGCLEDGDFVIACEGQGGAPDWAEDVLKTVRLTPTMVLGCTGDTDFMRPVLSALGFCGVERSEDTRIFGDIEESGQLLRVSHDQAWARIRKVVSPNADLYNKDENGLAVALIAKRRQRRYVTVWSGENKWAPVESQVYSDFDSETLFIGHLPQGVAKPDVWRRCLEGYGAMSLEDRLAGAIRWCADQQSEGERKINGNVRTRRMSEEFKLRPRLTPRS